MTDWEFRFAVLILAVFLLLGGLSYLGIGTARSESTYTGYIVDTEINRGYIFWTSTAHLKTHFRSSAHEAFCLPTDEMVQRVEEVQAAKPKVQITFSRPCGSLLPSVTADCR